MVAAAQAALDAAGIADPIGVVLADAGYWSEDNATAEGPDRLIATLKDYKQRRAARELGTTTGLPPDGASVLDAMEHRLRTLMAPPSTPSDPTPSSPSSATTKRTVGSAGSAAGACPPCAANGRSST